MHRIGSNDRPDLPVAVVIGAGGMGMATARRLGQTHRIVLASQSGPKMAERQRLLEDDGVDALGVQCDMTDAGSVAALVETVSGHGRFRTLAHVGALSPSMGDFRTIMRVNLLGAHLVERAFVGLAGQGCAAVFVGSLAGHLQPATPEQHAIMDDPQAPDMLDRLEADLGDDLATTRAYALSKSALMRMARRRAREWGAKGARIVTMTPGMIATPMGALEFRNNPIKYELLKASPIAREGTMVECADAIEFLASDRASFITGTDLLVDGGVAAALTHPA